MIKLNLSQFIQIFLFVCQIRSSCVGCGPTQELPFKQLVYKNLKVKVNLKLIIE